MVAAKITDVYLETVETDKDEVRQPAQTGATQTKSVGICQHPQGLLAYIKQFYPVNHNNQRPIESGRLHLLQRLLQIADNRLLENRRVPNGTHGGVRGRKTKVGRKLLRFPPTRFPKSPLGRTPRIQVCKFLMDAIRKMCV